MAIGVAVEDVTGTIRPRFAGSADDGIAIAVVIARMKVPFPDQTRYIRLDSPVGHYRYVLYRDKPAPHSRRPSAHRIDHDPSGFPVFCADDSSS